MCKGPELRWALRTVVLKIFGLRIPFTHLRILEDQLVFMWIKSRAAT